MAIIKASDRPVYERLIRLNVPPFFSISWILTLFTHDVDSITVARSLLDYFIDRHPSAVIYASAAVPLLFRDELLSKTCEDSEIHQWLKELPARIHPSILIKKTEIMMRRHSRVFLIFPGRMYLERTVYGSGLVQLMAMVLVFTLFCYIIFIRF